MKQELKRAFCSPYFFLGTASMLICMLCMTLPEWFAIEWTSDAEINAIIKSEGMSSLQYALYAIFFGGFILLVPFCACLPYAITNVDEIKSGYLFWMVKRTSLKAYAAKKVAVAALSGACVIMLPFILHAVLWFFLALPSDPITYPNQELTFTEGCYYNEWYQTLYGLPMYISCTLGIGLTSGIWSVVALAISIWLPDPLLVITVPSCFFYLWMRGLPRRLFGISDPGPSALYNDALTPERLLQSLYAYTLLLLIAVLVYIVGLKRRTRNA
ncbi:MAG: hypothetical protein RR975_08105 [Clostridia bacterium]